MNALTSLFSRTVSTAKFRLSKHGPAIAVTAGVIGMGATVYLTYRAATKIEQAKRQRNEELNLVEIYKENGLIDEIDGGGVAPYSAEDAERDTKIYKSRFIVNCVKYAAPAVVTFIISSFLIGKGFKTMVARAASLGAAVATLSSQLIEVREELENVAGQKATNDIFLGKTTHTETELKEDGSVESKEVTSTERTVSGYTFEFSKETSPMLYSGIYKRDKDFIEGNLRHANWILDEKKGYITFNDILEDFEVKTVSYGQTDGIVRRDGKSVIFDVDEREYTDDEGVTRTYFIITVNCDGYILNQI